MNQLIKITLFIGLLLCVPFVWVGCAIIGFFFAFTDWSIMYQITPAIGLASVICIIKCAIYVLNKSNPIGYVTNKLMWLESKFGK